MLGVEVNFGEIFLAYRLEGSEADVESKGLDLYLFFFELLEDLRGEVEAGSGGGG